MYSKYISLATLCLFANIVIHSNGIGFRPKPKVRELFQLEVTVLYSALSPDSVEFITTQLYPAWSSLVPYTTFTYMPFGHAYSLNNGESFVCQHGPEECQGNRMQICALDLLRHFPSQQIHFLACQMNGYSDLNGTECIEYGGLKVDDVRKCERSDYSTHLLMQAEFIKEQVAPTLIPAVLYNWAFNPTLQVASLRNFKGVACSFIPKAYGCMTTTKTFQ